MAEERSNFFQTLITAGIGIVAGVIGWGFIKNWLDKKKEKPEDAHAQSSGGRDTSTSTAAPVDVFTDNMKIADAKVLAQDAKKIPDAAARAQIQLILKQVESREKLGRLHEFPLGSSLEQVRNGGDGERYSFLNLTTIAQIDEISKSKEIARRYFPNMGDAEYKALRTTVDFAIRQSHPTDKPLPEDVFDVLLKHLKQDRTKDLEQQQVEVRKQQTMRELFPNANPAIALAHLDVTGVEPPSVAATASSGGSSGRGHQP